MSVLTAFTDFMLLTRDHPLSSVDNIPNDSTKYRTTLFRKMMGGLAPEKYVQGGSKIVDHVRLSGGGSRQRYNPTQTDFQFSPNATMKRIESNWRFNLCSAQWTEQEIQLNDGNLVDTFKRLESVKKGTAQQDGYEGFEDDLWASADYAEMETASPSIGKPYSIPSMITFDGLAPTSTNTSVASGSSSWTTVETIDPTDTATNSNWKNQFESYDKTSDTTVNSTLPKALDSMWLDVQFESPSSTQDYFKDTRLNKMTIATSKTGVVVWQRVSRAANDRSVLAQNQVTDLGFLAGKANYAGLPVEQISAIDTLWAAKDTAAVSQPVYYWVNFNHVYPVFHTGHFMKYKSVGPTPNQPFSTLMIWDTWYNYFWESRKRHGVVFGA